MEPDGTMLSLVLLLFVFGPSRGDYPCLCSYDVEKQVHSSPAQSSQLLGYLYEFDCKPYLSNGTGDPNIWAAIAFDKQFGYVQLDQQTTRQICPGDPSVSDALTTSQPTTITTDQTTVTASETLSTTLTSVNIPTDTSSNPTTAENITSAKATNLTTVSTLAMATNTTLSSTISSSTLTTNKSTPTTSIPTFTTEVSTMGTNTTSTLPSSTTGAKSTLTLPNSTMGTKSTLTLPTSTMGTKSAATLPTGAKSTLTLPNSTMETKSTLTLPTSTMGTKSAATLPSSTTKSTMSSNIPYKSTTTSTAKPPVTFKLVTTIVPSTKSTAKQSISTTPVLSTRSSTNATLTKASTTLSMSSNTIKLTTLLATQSATVITSTMSAKPTPTTLKTSTIKLTKPSTTVSSKPTTSKSTSESTTLIQTPTQTASKPTAKTTTVASTSRSTASSPTVSSAPPSTLSSSQSTPTLPTSTPTVTKAYSTTQGLTGDISLCPTTELQYAQKYGDILAQYGNSCYTVVDFKAAWEHAENICQSHGGHLLHIANKDENDFIYRLLHEKFSHAVWIGLQDFDSEEHFKWTSGDPVTYTNWAPGRKNNRYSHYEEDCVEFIPYQGHGQWDDIPCGYYKDDDFDESEGYTKNFICEHAISNQPTVTSIAQTSKSAQTLKAVTSSPSPMTSTSSPPISLPTSSGLTGNTALCPESQRNYAMIFGNMIAQYKSSCYSVIDFKASWDHAEDICARQGGHLFHISSQDENDFIYNLLHDRFSHTVWMGLHDTDREEHFKWTSGVPVTYTHWLPGRKSNHEPHKEEDCVEFIPYRNHGAWDDIPCGEYNLYSQDEGYTKYFICQNSIVKPGSTSQTGTAGNTNPCTPKLQAAAQRFGGIFANHGNSCYVLEPRDSSWVDAEEGCRKYGGHLVQISDQNEQDFIQKFVQQYDPQDDVWIGLHDQDQEDTYIWTSYQPVTYTNWVPGHRSDDDDDCVVLMPFKQGQWHDVPCGDPDEDADPDTAESHHFVCEFGATATSTGSAGPVLIGK